MHEISRLGTVRVDELHCSAKLMIRALARPRRLVHAPKSEAMKRSFRQVNVFSADPLGGNPLAVVHAADGLSEQRMAAFARWTHLSETTYLLDPTDDAADYRVRYSRRAGNCLLPGTRRSAPVTPGLLRVECRALKVVIQQCETGLVRIRRDGLRLEFAAPPLQRTSPLEPAWSVGYQGPEADVV